MLLFITASFPNYKDGIGDSAFKLYTAIKQNYEDTVLLTTENDMINKTIIDSDKYYLLKNWKLNLNNIRDICNIIDINNITDIHIEYPGKLYKKEMLITLLPLILMIKYRKKIKIYVRLHEYTQSRKSRKMVTLPILFFSNKFCVPSYTDYIYLKRKFGKKIFKTYIGSNIDVVYSKNLNISNPKVISYFGFIYPNKGFEDILKTCFILKTQYNYQFVFKIIGELDKNNVDFGNYHASILDLINKYDLKSNILITGYLSTEEVSKEISMSDIALLLYNDGLTLRRGSFISFFEHGIPIVTTVGDKESKDILKNAKGVIQVENAEEAANSIVNFFNKNSTETLKKIYDDNIVIAKMFGWNKIALEMLKIYNLK